MIQLGKNLVEELGLHDSTDTLGRWMAHHVAELITAAENAGPKDKSAKMRACREAILDLWQHRYELPERKRPFRDLESIARALESLDPNNETARYFRGTRPPREEASAESKEAREWLELAEGFDYSARVLMRFCLHNAARRSLHKNAAWVVTAMAAGTEEGFERPLLRVISGERDLLTGEKLDEVALKEIEKRISRLDGFTRMASILSALFKAQHEKEKRRLRESKAPSGRRSRKPKSEKKKAQTKR